jgi:anaerobic selenocysteine-containing dehydrogenase
MNRRDFIKYLGTVGALGTGSNWVVDRLWAMVQDGQLGRDLAESPGLESWVNSICQLCPGGCGIKVRLVDGLPVKIKGNPVYPINRGGLCPVGHSGLQLLYNPDRIRYPMKRAGTPGSNQWEPVSWSEALRTIQNKLSQMRFSRHTQRLAFLDGGSRGLSTMIFKQFLSTFGSPNYIRTDEWENRKVVYHFMQGSDNMPGFDLENTQFVLSFGADLLEAESSVVWFSRHLTAMRHRPGQPRGRLVQIDPRQSITAVKSDKWIRIRSGTEGALALGIAYMIIQENLYDREFIEKYTSGFEDWIDDTGNKHIGFKTLVLSDYYPEAVWRMTGISIEDIVMLARNFAENQPAVAICGKNVIRHPNGFFAQMAIHSLNALAGSFGRPGGIINREGLPLDDWPVPYLDETARKGLREVRIDQSRTEFLPFAPNVPSNLATHILEDQPYPIELLFLYKSNPVFELAEQAKVKKALEKIPFVVSFSSFLDESSQFAHLILPDSLYLESWQVDFDVPYTYFDHLGVGQPVINPIGNTKSTGDFILELANAIGGTFNSSLPFRNYYSAIRWVAERVFKSGRGIVAQGEFDEAWVEFLENRGWRYPRHKTFDEFWQRLIVQGGWVDPVRTQVFLKDAFNTPSGKFEFYLLGVKQDLEKYALARAKLTSTSSDFELENMIKDLKIQARGDTLYLPHHEPTRFLGDEFDYPYYLIPFDINTTGYGDAINSPMLLEMIGFRQYMRWDSWAEIHPETALELGVQEGGWIWIESPVWKAEVRVRISSGVHPELVNIPIGLGHTNMGRYPKNKGINPHELLVNDFDRMGGIPSKLGTRVNLYKA